MIGIFIIARLGSTRLPQKHLIQAAGKPFIEWLARRFQSAFQEDILAGNTQIFIVTADTQENRLFEELFHGLPVSVFYGSNENIPLRLLQCAEANGITNIISVDGDDILCSTQAARIVAEHLAAGCEIAQSKGLPLGMNISGYNVAFLKQALIPHLETEKLETGWGVIFDKGKKCIFPLGEHDKDEKLRLTLDYEADATFFKTIIEALEEAVITIHDEALIAYIIQNRLYEITDGLQDIYWKNFNSQKQTEL